MTKLHSKSAREIISFLMNTAKEENLGIAAAVADDHGELLAFARTDSCGLPSIKVAISKAFSAARLRTSTRDYRKEGFDTTNLAESGYTQYPGGLPIMDGSTCLGGIGVSGLTPDEDEALVLRALENHFEAI